MAPTADEIRSAFVDYFVSRGHKHLPSGSLIPGDDPTLLFTNAGMNQFKDIFVGEVERSVPRAVTSQKCMRVSGKHNDLDNVGPSLTHHTFFEMLGNFSFGDYFKAEAIRMAWELCVEGFGLPPERLWASVYEQDDEAGELWLQESDVPASRIVRLGKEDNYWSMGDTGPCGPCSEIYFDWEPPADGVAGDGDQPGSDSGRFVELWNLVFMQFNTDSSGVVSPLPSPNIDTGAGLERVTAVLQGTRSSYDTDLFAPIIAGVAAQAGITYGEADESDVALRVIADHSRALAFLLADGVMPANEGRGYVLRRVLRRAMRFGMKLGFDRPFLHASAAAVVERMGTTFPELSEQRQLIGCVVSGEEERFLQTLAGASRVFNERVDELRSAGESSIPGEVAFALYDTHGLPLELAREFAEAEGMTIDEAGFDSAMEGQRSRARAAWKGGAGVDEPLRELLRGAVADDPSWTGEFVGYELLSIDDACVVGLVANGELVERLGVGDEGGLVTDRTPFYAESGGQVGDRGVVTTSEGDGVRAEVEDTTRPVAGVILHRVRVLDGELALGDRVTLSVDADRRLDTRSNHTSTHLLHAVLRERLGEHVRQAGSLIEPERLRFDFAHYEAIPSSMLEQLEADINTAIRADIEVETVETDHAAAIAKGALAFFGEKYGDRVRVVNVPGISMELCGGTHVSRTGEIGGLVIQREESVAAGTRRIEAVTGRAALQATQRYRDLVRRAASGVKASEDQLPDHVERLVQRAQQAERAAEQLRLELAAERAQASLRAAEGGFGGTETAGEGSVQVDGVHLLRQRVDGLDPAGMRNLADELKESLGSGIVVLASRQGAKAGFVVGVTADLTARVGAGDLVRRLAAIVGGGGGGKPGLAQAGGPDGERLEEALEKAPEILAELLP